MIINNLGVWTDIANYRDITIVKRQPHFDCFIGGGGWGGGGDEPLARASVKAYYPIPFKRWMVTNNKKLS